LFEPQEVDLSRVIAFLLDPAATHGQRKDFLGLFLKLAELPEPNDREDSIRVWREDVLKTGEGRADIRVDYTCSDGRGMHLLIENKPWAVDGANQIEKYATYMATRYISNWVIVYMPSIERDPEEHSIKPERLKPLVERRQFVCIPYTALQGKPSVRRWLQFCGQQCEAEAPRRFISDLMTYLAQNVPNAGVLKLNASERSTSNIILSFLQERDKDIDIALEIDRALKALRVSLAEAVGQRIADGVRGSLQGDWRIDAEFSADIYSGLSFRRDRWPSGKNAAGEDCYCWVGLEFGSWNWKKAKFGVAAHRDIIVAGTRNRIAESVRCEFSYLDSQNDYWPTSSRNLVDIPSDWLSDEFLSFARRIKRGETEACHAIEQFVETLVRIGAIVDGVLARSTDRSA
jgi:hypothetical protein